MAFVDPEQIVTNIRVARAAARRLKDFDDLQLEMSGFIVGPAPRFLSQKQIDQIRIAQGLSVAAPASKSMLDYMTQTTEITRQIDVLDRATERALERSRNRVEAAQQDLDRLRDRADTDKTGQRVYRTENHQHAYTESGKELTAQQMAEVQWTPGSTTWEQHQAAAQKVKEALQAYQAVQAYKERLSYYREVISNGNRLPDSELAEIRKDINAMPPDVRTELQDGHTIPPVSKDAQKGPDLLAGFSLAALDIAAIKEASPQAAIVQKIPQNAPVIH